MTRDDQPAALDDAVARDVSAALRALQRGPAPEPALGEVEARARRWLSGLERAPGPGGSGAFEVPVFVIVGEPAEREFETPHELAGWAEARLERWLTSRAPGRLAAARAVARALRDRVGALSLAACALGIEMPGETCHAPLEARAWLHRVGVRLRFDDDPYGSACLRCYVGA